MEWDSKSPGLEAMLLGFWLGLAILELTGKLMSSN